MKAVKKWLSASEIGHRIRTIYDTTQIVHCVTNPHKNQYLRRNKDSEEFGKHEHAQSLHHETNSSDQVNYNKEVPIIWK